MAEEILEIADADCTVDGKPDNALVQQARLRVDTRKWLLSKMIPKKFGDKVAIDATIRKDASEMTDEELMAIAASKATVIEHSPED